MLKVRNIETPKGRSSGAFIVNFEHNLHLFSSASIVGFEKVNISREIRTIKSVPHVPETGWIWNFPAQRSIEKPVKHRRCRVIRKWLMAFTRSLNSQKAPSWTVFDRVLNTPSCKCMWIFVFSQIRRYLGIKLFFDNPNEGRAFAKYFYL